MWTKAMCILLVLVIVNGLAWAFLWALDKELQQDEERYRARQAEIGSCFP